MWMVGGRREAKFSWGQGLLTVLARVRKRMTGAVTFSSLPTGAWPSDMVRRRLPIRVKWEARMKILEIKHWWPMSLPEMVGPGSDAGGYT